MDVIQAIKDRRSINFFEQGKTIPDEKLTELLEIANLAPSSFNLQPWKVVVVRDLERKRALRKCANNQPKVEEASAVLIVIADPGSLEENAGRVLESWVRLGYMTEEQREKSAGAAVRMYGEKGTEKRRFFSLKNTALFAMNLMIAARGLGLETHPMDGFKEECVKKEFGIPEDKIIPMLIAVGYLKTGVELKPRAFRRAIGDFVKFERY